MIEELGLQLNQFMEVSKVHLPKMLWIIAGLWVFSIINFRLGKPFNILGIVPRRPRGLFGIVFAPILHSNYNHLFFNTIPLFFLGLFAMSLDEIRFYWATGIITVLAGLFVWLFGRRGNHVGASGLIAGYFGYLMGEAVQRPTITALFCGAIALYYFGGIITSLFPSEEKTSWEGHLFGFLSGIATIFICQYLNL